MKKRPVFWVLIGLAVAILLGLVITLAFAIGRFIGGEAGCDRGLGPSNCPVDAETIEALTRMDLPWPEKTKTGLLGRRTRPCRRPGEEEPEASEKRD